MFVEIAAQRLSLHAVSRVLLTRVDCSVMIHAR